MESTGGGIRTLSQSQESSFARDFEPVFREMDRDGWVEAGTPA